MTTTADRDLEPVVSGERNGLDHIGCPSGAHDETRSIRLHGIEGNTRARVPRFRRGERLAAEAHPQLAERLVRDLDALPVERGELRRHRRSFLRGTVCAASLGRCDGLHKRLTRQTFERSSAVTGYRTTHRDARRVPARHRSWTSLLTAWLSPGRASRLPLARNTNRPSS